MDLSREARDVIISNGSCKKLLEWSNKEDTFCWIRVLKKSHKNEKFSINESQLKFLEWAHPARAYLTFCATTSTTTTTTTTAAPTKQITIQSTKSNLAETKEPAEYGAALLGRTTFARIYNWRYWSTKLVCYCQPHLNGKTPSHSAWRPAWAERW